MRDPLRILSYNVSWGVLSGDATSSEGVWVEGCRRRGWDCRARVQELIDAATPDLMLLQEFVPDKLRIDPRTYQVRTWTSGKETGAIVGRRARVGRIGGRTLAAMSVGDPEGRVALAVSFPRRQLVVASVHAGHDPTARDRDLRAFAEAIGSTVARRGLAVKAVVMGGDFNGVCAERLVCCGHVLHAPPHWPLSCCRKAAPTTGRARVEQSSDAVLASGAPPPQAALPWPASDHDPVLATAGGDPAAQQADLICWLASTQRAI